MWTQWNRKSDPYYADFARGEVTKTEALLGSIQDLERALTKAELSPDDDLAPENIDDATLDAELSDLLDYWEISTELAKNSGNSQRQPRCH